MRVITYNVCRFRWRDARRVVREVLERSEPDAVALQEVTLGEELDELGRTLGMRVHFCRARATRAGGSYGHALLTRLPADVRTIALPGDGEPRAALVGEVRPGGARVRWISTHLALGAKTRAAQAEALADIVRAGEGPAVLCGDLNAPRGSRAHRVLSEVLADAGGGPSFPSAAPLVRIDHVLVSGLRVEACEVLREARWASDHRPVRADLVAPG